MTSNWNAVKYKSVLPAINLTKAHGAKRIAAVTKWFEDQHCWKLTIFSDEKRFSLDGQMIGTAMF